jgi:hypothetical protein
VISTRAPARDRNRNRNREADHEHEHDYEKRKQMIARIWHGWTKPADAKAYEDLLRDKIFPGIARRNIKGYLGAESRMDERSRHYRVAI